MARRGSVPFYDFFEAVNPLFGAFAKHDAQSLKAVPSEAVAFILSSSRPCASLRRGPGAAGRRAAHCLAAEGDEALLDREAVLALLDAAPAAYSRPRDFCALVQPLDDRGADWVLNLMAEGRRGSAAASPPPWTRPCGRLSPSLSCGLRCGPKTAARSSWSTSTAAPAIRRTCTCR